jgi:hypothetical protein
MQENPSEEDRLCRYIREEQPEGLLVECGSFSPYQGEVPQPPERAKDQAGGVLAGEQSWERESPPRELLAQTVGEGEYPQENGQQQPGAFAQCRRSRTCP